MDNSGDDETVPTYTETDEGDLVMAAFIADALATASPGPERDGDNNDNGDSSALPERFRDLPLPLTQYPIAGHDWQGAPRVALLTDSSLPAELQTQVQLIEALYHAVRHKNDEVVTALVSRGLVSPDVPDAAGSTPLIAAVAAGNGAMVCTLARLGASVNGYGTYDDGNSPATHLYNYHHFTTLKQLTEQQLMRQRTPLMVAAARGNLALAKLLVQDLGADDALIAPDGQLALRLAADAGHRDIVGFLPVRRGGGWRRWQVTHAVAVRRIRRAARNILRFLQFFAWDVPKFVLWTVPKHVVVRPLFKSARYAWKNKQRLAAWAARQARALPGRAVRGAKETWRVAKKVPGGVWRVAKAVPGLLRRLFLWLGRVVRRIPAALRKVWAWVSRSAQRLGGAVAGVMLRIAAAAHTAVMAVLNLFRRITLRDVWHGLVGVLRAVFVDFPWAVWGILKAAGHMAVDVFVGLFGFTALVIVTIAQGLWWVFKYVPRQLWKILRSIGSSFAKGWHEVAVWFNPKH
ncbi:hypothetical protein B0T26DRAFT_876594 [Lasiosphaeria miniovina]|uniref:protein S-acyltransferase n=1 Tax=Lasiosphaeria miniovina TaxID=1954250 RepID=A0AA39ZU94_9PEZI|nr:uncharacterized protein B0T26DRAFT_876594 [Lasiosphaeria miniovina]KAK0703676.1 hypothetical protein B0T26DRAFT_876594 [Lasiosphaeria miniovina]